MLCDLCVTPEQPFKVLQTPTGICSCLQSITSNLILQKTKILAGYQTVWCKLWDKFNKCSDANYSGSPAATLCHPRQPDSVPWCVHCGQWGARVVHPWKLCLSAKLFRGLTARRADTTSSNHIFLPQHPSQQQQPYYQQWSKVILSYCECVLYWHII